MLKLTTLTKYLILAILTCVIVSCGGIGGEQERQTVSNFKVAAILPGEINDHSWGQSTYQGLQLIEKQLIAESAYTSGVDHQTSIQLENTFRQYAEQGFDFILGQSGNYIPALEAIAKQFPRTKFAVLESYPGNNFNLGSLSFRNGELGYLSGTIAALKSQTHKISFIGGIESTAAKEVAILFERGAKAIQPNIQVNIQWLGANSDPATAQAVAQTQIQTGSDVLLVRAEHAGAAIHQLAKERQIHTIGWVEDCYNLAPGTVLTSGIQQVPELLLQGATLVRQGRWEGKQYKFGLREGVQDLAPFRGTLTSEEEATVNQIKAEIVTGKIDVSL
ncbi:BMP family protein [Pantanalinema sp. GBBB05]|uniref:BMP family protein n=1 Tax=Pantanalinema sp. GBBB05 TaxID=2604139 RepID=UPI001D3FF91B|nr:BMP family ABC transporter substrate-binding protein [Pantanalinema sp. GBBB05]